MRDWMAGPQGAEIFFRIAPRRRVKVESSRATSLKAVSEAAPWKESLISLGVCGRFRYSDLKEAAFVRGGHGGALWDFNRLWLGRC